jgi:phosphinothricin acetyltransferase
MPDLDLSIRAASPSDAPGVWAIYQPIVSDTVISFETTPPTEAQLADRIRSASETHGWLVAESGGQIAGYAYATAHRDRHAYRYSVETSVYVRPDYHGRGVGSSLYQRLFTDLASRGFFHAYAGITMPNEASTALHGRAGFRHIGTFPHVGFKFGQWHDVSWWHRPIQPGTPTDDQ